MTFSHCQLELSLRKASTTLCIGIQEWGFVIGTKKYGMAIILSYSILYNFSNFRILSGGSFWKGFRSVKVLTAWGLGFGSQLLKCARVNIRQDWLQTPNWGFVCREMLAVISVQTAATVLFWTWYSISHTVTFYRHSVVKEAGISNSFSASDQTVNFVKVFTRDS